MVGGWKDWLCCASNEICYTAPNLEAACSPTALPSDSTKTITLGDSTVTITIPPFVLTSLVRSTKLVTKTVHFSQTGHQSHRTSLVTLTSVETSTVLYSSPLSKPTATGDHHHNAAQIPEKQHAGLTTAEQAAVGASVSGAVIIAGLACFFWFWRRRQPRHLREDSQDGDGPDSFSPRNFAQVQHKNPSTMRSADIVPFLKPRQSAILSGPNNPYTSDPDGAAPPYQAAQAQGYVAGYQQPPGPARSPIINNQQQFQAPPASRAARSSGGRSSRGVPPRRPVGGMQPTVEDDYEY